MPKFTRDRPRVPGSWRDRQKGDCFTTRGGAVVCANSKGMKYKKHQDKGDKELEDKYGGWSVKELNVKLDTMKGTSSAGGGSRASKIRKIHKHGGRLQIKPTKKSVVKKPRKMTDDEKAERSLRKFREEQTELARLKEATAKLRYRG
tara:strand:- start:1235 stop:1675 length:441 start_codon:yes stop_codon:yes gene_type:complete